ncbi:YrzE family protein [Bartonella sp. CB189]|uniref:YrzE family protein n=1 Tax=Bartonella sp. CB189 TaxID=3112254 RepID=UPI002F961C7C
METRIPVDTLDTHFLKETSIETESPLFYTPISWSAIFAGLITTLTISIFLSFLVAALGFGQVDFSSSAPPLKGTFLSIGIGSLIVMLLSLASGSFIAGRFAETSGAFHGFLTWALLILFMVIQAAFLASGAANLGAKAVVDSGSAVIQKTMSNSETDPFAIFPQLNGENLEDFLHDKSSHSVDFNELGNELYTALNKSDIPALDPDRLKKVYEAVLNDIGTTITAFKNDPSHYRAHLKNLSDRLSGHVQIITEKINKNDIINSLVNNGMTRSDAQKTADHAIDVYQKAEVKIEQAIKAIEKQADTLSKKLDTLAEDARDTADKAAETASHIGWWGFFGSLMGIVISSIFGYYGYRSRHKEPLHT